MFLCLWATLSCNTAWAQSKEKFDPTSVKLDQMQNGITNILTRIIDLEKKSGQSQEVEALKIEISDLKNTISTMRQDNLSATNVNATNIDKLASTLSEFSDFREGISVFQEDVKFQIPNLKSRLSDVESILIPIAGAQRVIKSDATTSAKIFRISSLGPLSNDLPLAENCVEIGRILSTYSDRSYNTAFVKSDNGVVKLCTYESGRWQVFEGDDFAPGHVVTAE